MQSATLCSIVLSIISWAVCDPCQGSTCLLLFSRNWELEPETASAHFFYDILNLFCHTQPKLTGQVLYNVPSRSNYHIVTVALKISCHKLIKVLTQPIEIYNRTLVPVRTNGGLRRRNDRRHEELLC